ncbi:MAG: hypothetical protein M3Z06_10355, partial [Actinomycetota bacterium]|nr:hypothetical protein [Actinomycetota bacterium]
AEQWNGTSWQIQSTPNPGASYSVLSDVSCLSTGLCTAVGYDNNGTNTVPLAEQYAPSASVPTGLTSPTITGRTVVGETLTEHHGTWTGSPTRYTYEWKDCNAAVTVCTTIATTRNYTLRARDVGSRLLVLETAYNSAGASIAESSVPTATVTRPAAARPPALQQAPKITGRVTLNHRLTASRGAWTGHPSSYSYRWFACQRIGELCTPIPGANHRPYRADRSVLNEQIEVWVTAYNRAGASAPARSSTRRTLTQR